MIIVLFTDVTIILCSAQLSLKDCVRDLMPYAHNDIRGSDAPSTLDGSNFLATSLCDHIEVRAPSCSSLKQEFANVMLFACICM